MGSFKKAGSYALVFMLAASGYKLSEASLDAFNETAQSHAEGRIPGASEIALSIGRNLVDYKDWDFSN